MLQGQILNEQRVYQVGDTLHFDVTLPNTIKIVDNNLGTIEYVPVKSLQKASYAFWVSRIDSLNKKLYHLVDNQVDAFYNNKKTEAFGSVVFNTDRKPFQGQLKLIPKVKGLFYLEVDKIMAGNIQINRDIEGVISMEIANVQKHLDLIYPYLPSFVNTSDTRDFYAFKVE